MTDEQIREIAERHANETVPNKATARLYAGTLPRQITEALCILGQAGFVPARCHTGFSPLAKGGKVTHVSWTQEGEALPADAKLAEEAKLLASLEEARHDMVAINRMQMMNIYKALSELVRLGQASVQEWIEMPKELADLRHEIFRLADFPAMYAGQALAKEDRSAVLAALTEGK